MRSCLAALMMLWLAPVVWSAPCANGTVNDYQALGAGCTHQGVVFNNFYTAPGAGFAAPIDPALVSVSPAGAPAAPALLFTFDDSVSPGAIHQLFLHFDVSAPSLVGSSIVLGSVSRSGDGVVTGVADICAGGGFNPDEPTGCPGDHQSLIAAYQNGIDFPEDQRPFAPTTFFDVFIDVTLDAGLAGSAGLGTLLIEFNLGEPGTGTVVPEPSSFALCAGALALAAFARRHIH